MNHCSESNRDRLGWGPIEILEGEGTFLGFVGVYAAIVVYAWELNKTILIVCGFTCRSVKDLFIVDIFLTTLEIEYLFKLRNRSNGS